MRVGIYDGFCTKVYFSILFLLPYFGFFRHIFDRNRPVYKLLHIYIYIFIMYIYIYIQFRIFLSD